MDSIQNLQNVVYAASTPWSRDLLKGQTVKLEFRFDGTITASGSGGVAALTGLAPALLISSNRIQIQRGDGNIIDIDPRDAYLLSKLIEGIERTRTAPTPGTSASAGSLISFSLPILNPLVPDESIYYIDTRIGRMRAVGSFGAMTDYAATNVASIAADLRPSQGLGIGEAANFELRISTVEFEIESASAELFREMAISDDLAVLGIMIRTHDSSAVGAAQFSNGLIRRLSLDIESESSPMQLRTTWGQLRESTQVMFNLANAELQTGVAFIDLRDANGWHGLRVLEKGSNLSFIFDTNTVPERDFVSLAAASGDRAVCTLIGYGMNEDALILMSEAAGASVDAEDEIE